MRQAVRRRRNTPTATPARTATSSGPSSDAGSCATRRWLKPDDRWTCSAPPLQTRRCRLQDLDLNVVKIARAAQLSGFSGKYIPQRHVRRQARYSMADGSMAVSMDELEQVFGKPTFETLTCPPSGPRSPYSDNGRACRNLRSRGLQDSTRTRCQRSRMGSGLSLLKAVQMCQAIGTTLAEVDMMARSRVAEAERRFKPPAARRSTQRARRA